MRITVQFSSLFHTLAGVEREVLEVAEGTTIDQLSGILAQKYQNLPLESENTPNASASEKGAYLPLTCLNSSVDRQICSA